MSELNLKTPVGQWVAHHPATSRVFHQLDMDFCCKGGVSLEDACRKKNLNPEEVLRRLNDALNQRPPSGEKDWTDASLSEFCTHIVDTHHEFLRSELPRLETMARRVAQVHGEAHPEVIEIRDVFLALRAELEPHMMKEENVLFPAICQLENATTQPQFPFGTVDNPIRMMEHEHDAAGAILRRLRQLTNQFQPPDEACNTYRALFDGLAELEADTHQHIHKENNILFPRAARLESDLVNNRLAV